MTRYGWVPGTRLEPIGAWWAAYSPASGETHVLNDESAVILEWVREHGDGTSAEAASGLSVELAVSVEHLTTSIELGWMPLLVAGLVRRTIDTAVAATT